MANSTTATTITHTGPEYKYLFYSPMSSTSSASFTQENYFDLLGFKPAGSGFPDMRDRLASDTNLCLRSTHDTFLNKVLTKDTLKVAVSAFLEKYGRIYWGIDNRDHLQEPDISKGFLYPRDAQREDSRWLFTTSFPIMTLLIP